MGIKRFSKHLLANRSRVRRAFSPKALAHIEEAIEASEASHAGQIRFVVEGALDGAPLLRDQSARARALEVFSHLRIWDTAHNNGVLICASDENRFEVAIVDAVSIANPFCLRLSVAAGQGDMDDARGHDSTIIAPNHASVKPLKLVARRHSATAAGGSRRAY